MRLFKLCILPILIGMVLAQETSGKHLVGGSINYKYLGQTIDNDHRYRVKLKIYRDAANPNAPPFDRDIEIGVYEDNQPLRLLKTVDIRVNNTTGKKVEPEYGGSECSFQPNVQIYKKTYQTTIELAPSSNGYHLTHKRCCRNNSLLNLIMNMGQTYYAYIPPTNKKNSSPKFTDVPAPYICAGDKTSISYEADDPDGDSLAYSFKVPYNGGSASDPKPGATPNLSLPIPKVSYSAGYSFQQPFGANGLAQIEELTGLATLKAPKKGRYALAVEVREFRNGKLLSTTRRDIQIIVLDCPDNPRPTYFRPNGPDKTDFSILEGDTLDLNIKFEDSDSMYLGYEGDVFDNIAPPTASMDSTKGIDTISTNFTWPTACGQSRSNPYIFSVVTRDRGCPPKQNITKITINVQNYKGSNILGAGSGCTLDNQELYTASLSKYAKDSVYWEVEGGQITSGQHTDSVRIDWKSPGKQQIKAFTVSKNGCNQDSSSRYVKVSSPPYGEAGPDYAMCTGDTIQIGNPSPDSNTNFAWSDNKLLNDTSVANPQFTTKNNASFPKKTDLEVRLSRSACTIQDTVSVTVNPKPKINKIVGDSLPCFEGTYPYKVFSPSATKYKWKSVGAKPEDTTTSSNQTRFKWTDRDTGSFYVVSENQFNCESDSFSKGVDIKNPVVDTIMGTRVVCPNSRRIRYWVDSQPGSKYHWSVSRGTIVGGQTNGLIRVNWSDSGSGYVNVVQENQQGCFSDTFKLPIKISYNLETSPISGDTSVCEFSNHGYSVKYTNGSTYDWSLDNGQFNKIQPGDNISVKWGGSNSNGLVKVLETSYDSVNDKVCKGDTIFQPVTINPLPDPSAIDGPDTLCQEQKGTFKVSGFKNSTFQWTYNKDSITSIWQRNDSIKIQFNKTGEYDIEVIELTKDSCKSQKRVKTIFIKDKPKSKSIKGLDTICSPKQKDITYKYNGDSASQFKWQIQGGELTNGQDKQKVSADWLIGGKQMLEVHEISQNGCSGDTIGKPVFVDLLNLQMTKVSTIKNEPGKIVIDWEIFNKQFFQKELKLLKKDTGRSSWSTLATYNNTENEEKDDQVKTNKTSYNYKLETENICDINVSSRVHRSILLNSEKPDEESLMLKWTPYKGWGSANIERYEIYIRTSDTSKNGYQYEFVKTVPGNETRTEVERTDKGAEQCYRIKAVKNGDNKIYSWSNETCREFPPFIYIPNAFSPWDKNGVNDEFNVKASNLVSFEMQIFTRWGEKVFETTNPEEGWDGMFKGQKAPAGTYLVAIEYEGYQLTKTYSGTVNLLR